MTRTLLDSDEARQQIARLVVAGKRNGYLDVVGTMRVLERSQITAYSYLRAMSMKGLVKLEHGEHRWYLTDAAYQLAPPLDAVAAPAVRTSGGRPRKRVEREGDEVQPVRIFSSTHDIKMPGEAARDPWVAALFGAVGSKGQP